MIQQAAPSKRQPLRSKKMRIKADFQSRWRRGESLFFHRSEFHQRHHEHMDSQAFVLVTYRLLWADGVTEITD